MTAMTVDHDEPAGTADDDTLVAQARAGDRAAFARLVERHYDFIHRVAYRLTGTPAEADDVAQDVAVRLGRAIRGFRGGSAFTTWLYALTLNAVRDGARRRAREAVKAEAWAAQALVEGAAVAADDPVEALWEAVRALPDKQRDAVTLVHGEGLSHAEAAAAMACAETTVSWHVHQAKKRLRRMLAAGED